MTLLTLLVQCIVAIKGHQTGSFIKVSSYSVNIILLPLPSYILTFTSIPCFQEKNAELQIFHIFPLTLSIGVCGLVYWKGLILTKTQKIKQLGRSSLAHRKIIHHLINSNYPDNPSHVLRTSGCRADQPTISGNSK